MSKIFLIIPTLHQGGAERVISELANEFSKQYEVHLVLLAYSDDFYPINPSIKTHRLDFVNRGEIQKKIAEIKTFFKLRKLFKTESPNAVLSFMDKYNVLTILASRFLNLNVFISDRSNPKKQLPKLITILKKLTYKYATGIIAQTSLAKEVLNKKTKHKNIKVIPNPVKEVKLYPEIEREKIILNVGRLVPEKGQQFLLEAFKNLNSPDWRLVILGNGPLREDLQNQAKKLQIENNVIMPGAVNNVDEWLAKASIFAFPSVSEGFPNALLEAMAAGLPCVSFDCDAGPRDIIKNGENGFLVPLNEIDAFAEKLNMLVVNEQLRIKLGEQGKKISEKYNLNEISKLYLNFLLNQI